MIKVLIIPYYRFEKKISMTTLLCQQQTDFGDFKGRVKSRFERFHFDKTRGSSWFKIKHFEIEQLNLSSLSCLTERIHFGRKT